MKIVFRVDSSLRIGTGHVMRCLALAEELREQNHSIDFICRALPGNLINQIQEKLFNIFVLPYDDNIAKTLDVLPEHKQWLGVHWEEDLHQSIKYISQTDWLVVDHYSLDYQWEKGMRKHVKRIMVIDDLADRTHDSDLLLDQNYYHNAEHRYKNNVPAYCKTLLGPRYALLRKEFAALRKSGSNRDFRINRIIVSLGGIDSQNITEIILEAIQHSKLKGSHVDVVMGTTSVHKDLIKQLCDKQPHFHFHSPAYNMAELMAKADLAIGAGGITTWERCVLGLPSLIVELAQNQNELIKNAEQLGICWSLGHYKNLNLVSIIKSLNQLANNSNHLQSMSESATKLTDGLGIEIVVKEICHI